VRCVRGVRSVRSMRGMGRVLRYHFQTLICLSEDELRRQPMMRTGLDDPRGVFRKGRKSWRSD
jgi:hypothetical protein